MHTLITHLGIPPEAVGTIPPGISSIQLPAEALPDAAQYLLNIDQSAYLSAIIVQEWEMNFELIYLFTGNEDLCLRINLSMETPLIQSICRLTPAASFYEREAQEMFGIHFIGLDNPANLLLPENEHNHPMRQSHPEKEA
ncbi:MAG: NADH-quinone oxidoreductase subunit C [Anaerolineae bacterium]|jgi:NADH:ubiquinone oxidoreductase subunit C|nr:NADH-quinone oxidoreductase subunit C [Anaerolineae bacterium]